MAEFKEDLVYKIELNYKDALNGLVKYKAEIDALTQANKTLRDDMKKEGADRETITRKIEANNAAIQQSKDAYREVNKELQSSMNIEKAKTGSLQQLSAEISKLNKQYSQMSIEERNSAKGTELATQLKEKRKAYEDVNVAAGNYKVMVGQYENQILSATGANKGFLGGLMAMAKEAGSVKAAVAVAGTSVQAFGKSLLALLANPIVAIISAIAVAIMAMKKAFDSSAEAQQRFSVLLAPLGRLMDALVNVLQKALFAILSIAEGFSNLVMSTSKLLEKLPGVGKYFKDINDETERANQLAKAKVALQNDEINNITKAAEERKKQIELEAIITDKANKSYAQRKAASDELSQVLDKQMAREIEIARERSRIAEEEASRSDNTLETNRQLAQYKADIANIEARRFEQQKTQNEKLNGLALEEAAIQKKTVDDARAAAKEREAIAKERVDKEKAAIADLYKSTLAIMAEGKEKEKALATASFDSEIAAINERLATEKNLTKAAREAINQIIINKETEKNNNLTAIDEKYSKEAIDKEAQKIADDLKKDLDAESLKWANKIAQARLKGEEYAQLELDSLRAKLENANIIEFESDDARLAYKLQIQQQIQDAETATAAHIGEVAKQNANNTYDAISTMAGGIADLFNAIGEDSEEFAAFSKALAIFQIGVNMAKGISEAVASSNVFEMAAHIASVLTGIAQAYKIVNSEKEPKAPKFADGGTVTGPGTGTSDSIPAMLSHGESVNTAAATDMFAPLYSTLNQLVGGAPIVSVNNINTQAAGEDFIATAVAKGVAGIRPVVSVEDISTATNRVKLIDNLSKFGTRG